jgi:hypothetical protein
MNLYLISQTENNGYDTYDSAVVCAETEEEARNIDPASDFRSRFLNDLNITMKWVKDDWSWASSPDKVDVKYLGVADPSIPKGVVCASFNAG